MNKDQAMDRIAEIAVDNGEGMLETLQYMNHVLQLQYMNDNLDQFSDQDRLAFRIVFAGFQKLFARAE